MSLRSLFYLAALATGLMLTSCARLRPQVAHRELPADAVPASFGEVPAVPVPARWWEEFGSPELNRLMDEAFAGNLNVAQAWARLRQVQAQARQAAADGKLHLTGSGEAGTSLARRETNGSLGRDSSNSFSLGLAASYELDLWGRIQASDQAATLAAQASEQDVQTTALALSGTLAATWLQYHYTLARIAVVEGQIDTGRKYLELLQVRQRKSMSDAVDVLQQQQQVASLESSLPPLHETVASVGLQLRYLLGRLPESPLDLTTGGLPELPPTIAVGVPARLLEQRPDIRAAWLRLRAQEWTVVEAQADRLPAITLSGSGSFSSAAIDQLFNTWALNLASSLTAPLVDGGRRRAAVDQAQALADERFLAYRDTVLAALHEVADALVREQWKREYLARLGTELRLATETLDETQRRYRSGVSDYLPVLTALSSQQKAELARVAALADLLSNRIDLCQAVGGQVVPDPATATTATEPIPGDGE